MLTRLMLASALLAASMFGSAQAASSVGEVKNPGFEMVVPPTTPGGFVTPLHWEQWGSGNATHPTVTITNTRAHSGQYSALFNPRSITNLTGSPYVASIYQQIDLIEMGQLLTLSFWMRPGEVPEGKDPSPNGAYSFVVSYDHDEDESVTLPFDVVSGSGQNGFFRYEVSWRAPAAHGHDNAYITLTFTTNDTAIYMYLDDITLTAPLIVGDPQFVGLRGQNFQVHGIDGAVYNLISLPDTQVNSQFKFLSEGECPVINGVSDTNCWSHPGSYLGSIGLQQVVDGKLHQLTLVAGPAQEGFASITVNDQPIAVDDSFEDTDAFTVRRVSSHRVQVQTAEFMFTFDNSDMFINQAVVSRVPMSQLKSHGLFGQTHQAKLYPSALKYIAGDVDDYMIEENTLFGKSFVFNQFQH